MEKWVGKVAVVTGASAGIGAAIVKSFARNGIIVIGLARRSEKIEDYARELGNVKGQIFAVKCDVSSLRSIKSAFRWIEQEFGVIHILVNNAAVLHAGGILDEVEDSESNCIDVIDTNISGVVHCTRAGVRLIKKSNDYGLVVNVCSVAGHYIPAIGRYNLYAPSKFAVKAFSETLRLELAAENNRKIRVTNLSPGGVQTEMAMSALKSMDKKILEKYANMKDAAILQTDDISLTVESLLQLPFNVNICEMTVRAVGESV